ncbi:MAG: hypothetical protein II767_13550, partial [Proteobacteria bacterium]|nr:hypothetical protein [Pseudomonadota bacterium]
MIKLSDIITSLKRNPKARDIRNYCFQLLADINSYEDEYEVVNAYTGKQKNRKNGERHPVLFRNFAKAFKNEDFEMLAYYLTECISANTEFMIREIAASNAKSIGMLGEAIEHQFDRLNNNLERIINIIDPNLPKQDIEQNTQPTAEPQPQSKFVVVDNLNISATPTLSQPMLQPIASPQSAAPIKDDSTQSDTSSDSDESTVITACPAFPKKPSPNTEDDDDEEYED